MVKVESGGRKLEYVLKEFRKKVDKSQIKREANNKREYIKPSARRREEIKKAKYRTNKYGNR